MSGLKLLCEYSSDSEDDKIEQEDYPSQSQKLPLPKCISTWEGVVHHEKVISDPEKHAGRIRSFEHERGNWATLVYIKYVPSDSILYWMNQIKSQVNIDNVSLHEEFHISLTRTLILKYHWIDSFVESIKKLCVSVPKFTVKLLDLKVYCNENETRTFLGLSCFDENGTLEYLTKQFDQLLAEYKLPPFYEDASYHISFLWCLGNKKKQLEKCLPDLSESLNILLEEEWREKLIVVNKLQCKIGNRNYEFNLKD